MPTVNGFNTNLGVLKYNAEALENYNTPDFSSEVIYSYGDYVINEGKLYKYISNTPSSGTWDISKWTLVILTDEIKELFEDVVEPSDIDPLMDNSTASAGVSEKFSRADHVHPSDITKQNLLVFDNEPIKNSTNPVTSDGIYNSLLNLCPKETITGNIVTFSDALNNTPLESVKYNINCVQSGSGDPSPTNIRPFIGYTFGNLYRTGKNLLNPTLYVGCAYNPTIGSTFNTNLNSTQFTDNHDGTFSFTTSSTWKYYCLLFSCKGLPQFRLKIQAASTGQLGRTYGFLDANFKVLTKDNSTDSSWTINTYFVPTANNNRAYFYMVLSNRGTASTTITVTQPQIELGNIATSYEPYNGRVIPVSWQSAAGTIYGGVYDLTNGELTVTHQLLNFTSDDVSGTPIKESNLWRISLLSSKYSGAYQNGLCDKYVLKTTYSEVNNNNNSIALNADSGIQILIRDDTFTSASDLLATFPINVYYPLSNPSVYQLTSEELLPLTGENNIWADTGSVSVEYYADIQLYIEKKIAAGIAAALNT